MGLVDFAIDLAAVLSASRSVASKHIALRARQVDRYGKTSSIVAAVRGQPQQRRPDPHDGPNDAHVVSGKGQTSATASEVPDGVGQHVNADDGARPSVEDITPSQSSSGDFLDSATIQGTQQDPGTAPSTRVQDSIRRQEAQQPQATTSGFIIPPMHSSAKSPTIQEPDLKEEKEGREKSQASKPYEDEEAKLPKGVDFEGLFRTSRGRRLDPLWKGTKRSERPRQSIPGAVDYGHTNAHQDSIILQELRNQRNETKSTASRVAEESELEDRARPTETKPASAPAEMIEAQQPKAEVNEAPSISKRQQMPPKEVPPTDPAGLETASTVQEPSNEHTAQSVTKEDASALGEMLGTATVETKYELRESKVPSSRFGRIWNYGGLAAGMFAGAVSESFSRVTGGGGQGSLMLSPANMERLVSKLSKMRGAALKLGQMMSFQDSKMLPAPIQEVLQRVQDRADYMPSWQRDRVLVTNLGSEWRDLFEDFEEKPIAAASIGQVHRATLKNGAKVAVKIQFPGVAESINSDLDNLGILLAATKLLPKGLYLNKTIDNARTELGWECDYEREAQCAQRYRSLLATEEDVFSVPKIYPEACGKQVLTMEFMDGVGVTRIKSFTQEQRDWIGTQILRLCLREITEFRFMQTDPNWTNFLYNAEQDRLVLLDFGASREYPDKFITQYVQLLEAASRTDRDGVRILSEQLGYLTGHESKTMLDAHIASVLTLAEPFLESAPETYDFRDQTITERVKAEIPVMIRERLAPPPEETYSLHRKLSGAFLLCARLGSRVRCREMFEQSLAKNGFRDQEA
ncbi:Atypical/ABC1/ABC1-A protein kinase [Diaporthe amygdali]|uniref:Atypical/ABC1/ABC1-A protein kinase n=1 Tax=Phomopsis amygdali TaxID=1214568 RepID=UPI0022FE5D32|nr:Atypical/ABC1/ABC1-A protein kinase [Diaporthe amygdali]KAJ0117629.1 Atypical/ABC1/ABC1-A protein kinase [Diaporthe amygdali]